MVFWEQSRRKNNKKQGRKTEAEMIKGKLKPQLSKCSKPSKCIKRKLLQYRKNVLEMDT